MTQRLETVCGIPALVLGEPSENVFLYVHGKMGSKEEAIDFGGIATAHGWQVLSIDLPEHGARQERPERLTPWQVVPELQAVYQEVRRRWSTVGLYATSMGAWFSMLALPSQELERCFFASPVVDMRLLIEKMMRWSSVTPEQLKREGEIPTDLGETLSWRYYTYAVEHPITRWNSPTTILFGEKDHLTDLETIQDFTRRFHCDLWVREGARHWFHTEEDLQNLRRWEEEHLR